MLAVQSGLNLSGAKRRDIAVQHLRQGWIWLNYMQCLNAA
jgi:hypothetical protein